MELLLRPWKLYSDSGGRSRRSEFWLFYLVKYGPLLLLGVFIAATDQGSGDSPALPAPVTIALLLWLLVTFVPSIVLLARRLHDFDASGKWVLTTFIPYLGFLAVLVIGLIPGTKGENEKGEDPRGIDPNVVAEIFE